ncbi:Hypothetical predicted protein, partial [Paramuricea clavata]
MAENKDSKMTYHVDTNYCEYVLIGDNITVNVYSQKGGEPQFIIAVASEEKEPPDTGKASQEMDARRKEIYKSSSVLEESKDKSHPAVFETTVKPQADAAGVKSPVQETSKTRQRISSLKKWVSLRGSTGGNKVQSEVLTNKEKRKVSLTSDNVGYIDTPPPSRRFSPATKKMCG